MTTIAIIPARGNSKGIPNKNTLKIGSVSLLERTLLRATLATHIDVVFVTSENEDILNSARDFGTTASKPVIAIARPTCLSQDHVQVDEVILYTLRQLEHSSYIENSVDTIVILQPTSIFCRKHNVDEAIDLYQLSNRDKLPFDKKETVFSCYMAEYVYEESFKNANMLAISDDPRFRLGRQWSGDSAYAIENGAIYVVDRQRLSRERTFRDVTMIPYYMDFWDSLQIDTPKDLAAAKGLIEYADYR